MKASKLLLIVLSCMLVIGCKKNKTEDEPTPPTPQYPVITMDSLKAYFPYQTVDRLIFEESGGFLGLTYTVKEATFTSKDNKMIASIFMDGIMETSSSDLHSDVQMTAEVTDKHLLKATVVVTYNGNYSVEGTYEYDTAKSGKLPDKLNFSNGAIVEKDKGLTHYVDAFGKEWDLFHTYYKQ